MKNYCPDLFQNLYVEKINETQTTIGFCCVSKVSPPTSEIKFDLDYLEEQRNYYRLTQELPHSCSQCINNEANGSTSRRLQELKNFNYHHGHNYVLTNDFRKLQYNCDNICNLKCIMCSSMYSSAWIKDEILLGKSPNKKIKPTKRNKLIFDFDVSKITQIYFNGGEPLMTRDHINVLNYALEHSDPKNINILYNTNATFPITEEMLFIWEKFRNVTLIASIDALHEQFEYIRFPAKWKLVEQNLLNYKNNVEINIGANIGIHNVLYFNDLYEYACENNIKFNLQSDTQGDLSLTNTPFHLIPLIKENLSKAVDSNLKETLLATLDLITRPSTRWVRRLYQLDKIRNTNWEHSLSKLYNLDSKFFNEYKNISY